MRWRQATLTEHGGNGPALPGPLRACFSAAREARAASGSDGVGTSPQRDFRVWVLGFMFDTKWRPDESLSVIELHEFELHEIL